MDWDKANFQKINQRRAEFKRWTKREESKTKKTPQKGSNHPPTNRKKRKKK